MSTATETIYEIMLPEGEGSEIDPTKIRLRALFTIPTPGDFPSSMHVIPGFPDTLYIGTVNSKVYKYDGTTITEISPAGAVDRVILTSLNGVLIAASSQKVHRLVNGVWSSITLPAGLPPTGVTLFLPTCAFEFNGNAYIGGRDGSASDVAAIIIISPAGVATMGTVYKPDASDLPFRVIDFASWRGDLYYLWEGMLLSGTTDYVILVKYGTAIKVDLDVESGLRANRLYTAGGRLFIGYVGNKPTGVPEDAPQLSELTDIALVSLVDRSAAGDSYGALDMIAF